MTTRVVNVRLDPFDTYIGRAGCGFLGPWGNPHSAGVCRVCSGKARRVVQHTREEALALFRRYFHERVERDEDFRREVLRLRGKVLGCFCARKGGVIASDQHICHGQVMAEWLDQQEGE